MPNQLEIPLNISVLNNKGGTGKTTTAVNVAAGFAAENKKVLLIDLDPQGNATTGIGFEKATLASTVYNLRAQTKRANETIHATKFQNLFLLPSHLPLASADVALAGSPGREDTLREALSALRGQVNTIVI